MKIKSTKKTVSQQLDQKHTVLSHQKGCFLWRTLQTSFTEVQPDEEVTYLRVNPQGRGVFYEGFNDSAAAECVRSHHQHLVLLHSVEERSHVGLDRLQIDNQKHQTKAWKMLLSTTLPQNWYLTTKGLTLWLFLGGESLLVGLPSAVSGALRLVLWRDLDKL